MIIHVFNPEHDLALAHGDSHFTPPHAARELRMNLGFLPALWASDGDVVLVDDADYAHKASARLHVAQAKVAFLTPEDFRLRFNPSVVVLSPGECQVQPWGWDAAVRHRLFQAGVPASLLPSDDQLAALRQLSHRRTAVGLLSALRSDPLLAPLTVGQSVECTTMDSVLQVVGLWRHVVLKAPWSSSGRGIKYVNRSLSRSQQGWCANTLREQGSVVAEAYNDKVMDFGMEFVSDGLGHVSYCGLSLFSTLNGAYTGNLLATEADKEVLLGAYLPSSLLGEVRSRLQELLAATVGTTYSGPLGIDMMVVAAPQTASSAAPSCLLNPCVELNLRRTMGHVALALSPAERPPHLSSSVHQPPRLMQITHISNYELKLRRQLANDQR